MENEETHFGPIISFANIVNDKDKVELTIIRKGYLKGGGGLGNI